MDDQLLLISSYLVGVNLSSEFQFLVSLLAVINFLSGNRFSNVRCIQWYWSGSCDLMCGQKDIVLNYLTI